MVMQHRVIIIMTIVRSNVFIVFGSCLLIIDVMLYEVSV